MVRLPDRIGRFGTVAVPKLDRLARSVPDARFVADALVARGVRLALGSSVYDPVDPMGKMFFNILATFAEFEADLIRLRTREGMAVARSRASCAASSRSSPTSSRRNCVACTTPAITRSAILPSCSPFHGRPSIARSLDRPAAQSRKQREISESTNRADIETFDVGLFPRF